MSYRRSRLIALGVGIMVASASVFPQSGIPPYDIQRVGQAGWQFLKINADARQAAMGGAFTAISQGDASAVFGNPAALTDVKNIDVQFNVLKWVADIGHQSIAVAWNLGDAGVVAGSVAMLDYGDVPETINSTTEGGITIPVMTGSVYSAKDIVGGITYARKITDNLSVGGSVRWMRESIAELSMNNWSFDIGTIYYTGFRSLRIAIAARNFGPDSRFGGWSELYQTESDNVRMPLDLRAGLAMDFFDGEGSPHVMTAVVEGDHPNDGTEKIHLGVSYCFNKIFTIRGGYKINYDVQRFTFGAGLQYSLGDILGSINYAYVDFGELTQVHMISIGLSF